MAIWNFQQNNSSFFFQCFYCSYYHWQKRTAERHVNEEHPAAFKVFVRDVRAEYEQLKKNKAADAKKKKTEDKKLVNGQTVKAEPEVISYLPYKCGLCDHASETLEAIREHSRSGHEIHCQFKCSLCDVASDNKAEVEKHCQDTHGSTSVMMRIYHVDPTSISNLDPNVAGMN